MYKKENIGTYRITAATERSNNLFLARDAQLLTNPTLFTLMAQSNAWKSFGLAETTYNLAGLIVRGKVCRYGKVLQNHAQQLKLFCKIDNISLEDAQKKVVTRK